ncbi:uncharacterized protein LOC123291477 [Chrysoperla carnea]|uniref:uncharacterized protein LOC123291477 n=1 Tax=Chrysoperla carnea TaxID=189513 RepID=UPI001D0835A4|nr:uncharacterized protein LOC123291477 [Chrysoperla carnea]
MTIYAAAPPPPPEILNETIITRNKRQTPPKDIQYPANTILVYIREQCYDYDFNISTVEQYLEINMQQYQQLNIVLMDRKDTCTISSTAAADDDGDTSTSSDTTDDSRGGNKNNFNMNDGKKQQQLAHLVTALSHVNVIGMVGSPAPAHCETIVHLARVWHKNLVTWTCPHHATTLSSTKNQVNDNTTTIFSTSNASKDGGDVPSSMATVTTNSTSSVGTTRHNHFHTEKDNIENKPLLPSSINEEKMDSPTDDWSIDGYERVVSRSLIAPVSVVASSLAAVIRELRWKSIIIITSDEGWWGSLAHTLDLSLRTHTGVVAKLFITVPQEATNHERIAKLLPLNNMPSRVIIICASLHPLGHSILSTIDNMRIVHRFGTFVILVDITSIQPYLEQQTTTTTTPSPQQQSSRTFDINIFSHHHQQSQHISSSTSPLSSRTSSSDSTADVPHRHYQEHHAGSGSHSLKPLIYTQNFVEKLTVSSQRNLLIYTATDINENITQLFSMTNNTIDQNFITDYLNESIYLIYENYIKGNPIQEKIFQFLLLDYVNTTWRPIFEITYNDTSDQKILSNYNEWKWRKVQLKSYLDSCDENGDNSDGDNPSTCNIVLDLPMTTAHILLIIACSILFAIILIISGFITRYHVVKKRLGKGPYKILLTATDFVFPSVTDSRRVDEGIEAMLCCWLQQLQEFGGPEVDKPDLLKGSVASLKGHTTTSQTKGASGSTSSLARTLLVDPRVRYNGDLVQLKELPSNQGTFELKSKAMDLLILIHGLRHENLNPFIGCLTEPTRPGLVSEWCTRGSLEDVLIMDDIKLDWSFRLSLLTDLVRGMRYLHSTPIRVHGYLTSRNCVIDARWVLKITDYGLPAFYEAQNITPPAKSARDLLWTAPELLRHCGLRKRGTQTGDVYSFGIIMQEVVVRGEPFCMLALTPEEIIEKVKRPPPLIRPSVSKGAAPPEAINIMRQCWAEQAEMRPDFNAVHDLFKKLNHGRKVNFVDTMFQMLEKYSNNLEELIRERTEQLDMEKKKTEQLLNRMLPSSVAEKLKLGMPVDPEEFREVTIYFSDIVGFTTISAYSTPFQVVDLLNDLYTCFDATINAYNVYKVETIGDAYMVVGGLPVRIPDHAEQIATMALDLLHQSGKFKIRHLPRTPLRLRIGLHTGPCCAGVVGLTMPRYCLFGDTVNTASRMESTGSAWRIHLSQATKDKLEQAGGYQIEFRGSTEIKGKGFMNTYWLLGKTGFDKPLPVPPPVGESHGLDECLVIHGKEISHTPSLNANRSEDNSSGDCSSSFGVPTGQGGSPCPPQSDSDQTNLAPKSVIKVCAAVHEEKSIKSMENRIDQSKLSSSASSKNNTFDQSDLRNFDTLQLIASKTHDQILSHVMKSTSTDTPMSTLGTPVSASEVAAAMLGASSSSLCNIASKFRTGPPRRVNVIDEDDLSSAYNHYRCLSPNDARITLGSNSNADRSGRFLKRQFSLDRGDDSRESNDTHSKPTPRLSKQNSAGAAHDLERIEEIPIGKSHASPCHHYRHASELTPPFHCSMSVSVDSLSLQ